MQVSGGGKEEEKPSVDTNLDVEAIEWMRSDPEHSYEKWLERKQSAKGNCLRLCFCDFLITFVTSLSNLRLATFFSPVLTKRISSEFYFQVP